MTSLLDNGLHYGLVSRWLHWATAALLGWQFLGVAVGAVLGRGPVSDFWSGTHTGVGVLVLALAVLRGGWGLMNLKRRPSMRGDHSGRLAVVGHLSLYALMIVLPTLALVRHLASEWPLSLFGWQVSAGREPEIEWLTAPGNALHSLLAWVLLAAIAGHIGMTLVHRYVWKDGVAARMLG